MKKVLLAGLLTIVLGFSSYANAELQNLGCGLMVEGVCQGNLIYDTVADVTWFDSTYKGPCPKVYDGATIAEANNWVTGLTVAGVTNWKLPTMSLSSDCLNVFSCLSCILNPSTCDPNVCQCILSNFTCDACKPVGPDNSNVAGFLYWRSLGGSGGTGPFASMDTSSGKYYWTSTTVINYPLVLSFSNGFAQPASDPDARYYAMAMHLGKVQPPLQRSMEQVQTSLTDFRGLITDEKDAATLEDAIQHLANTQNPAFWKPTLTEDNQVQYILNPATGKTAFREAELAVKSMNVLIARGYAVQRFVDEIIYVARWIAQNAISDAIAANNKPQNIAQAMDEMGKATEDALERYAQAWEAATK